MAAFEFFARTNQGEVPTTPQAIESKEVQESRQTVAYESAGQTPPTQGQLKGPLIRGGLQIIAAVIIVLWVAYVFFLHSHRSMGAHGGASAGAGAGVRVGPVGAAVGGGVEG